MKNYILTPLVMLLVVAATAGCSTERGDAGGISNGKTALGIITAVSRDGTPPYFTMRADDGSTLTAVQRATTGYELQMGQRVFCEYEVVGFSEYRNNYEIKLYGFHDIVFKPAVRESFVNGNYRHRADSIGNDLVRIFGAWFGGNCLNIEFDYLREKDSGKKHMISLVWTDEPGSFYYNNTDEGALYPEGAVHVFLRHNAFGENEGVNLVSNSGFVSFPISEIAPEGADSIEVVIHYNWEGRSEIGRFTINGTFRPDEYEYIYTGSATGGNYFM